MAVVLTDGRAAAALALASYAIVLTDSGAAAALALVSLAVMLTNGRAAATLALGSPSVVLTDGRAAAALASAVYAAVLTDGGADEVSNLSFLQRYFLRAWQPRLPLLLPARQALCTSDTAAARTLCTMYAPYAPCAHPASCCPPYASWIKEGGERERERKGEIDRAGETHKHAHARTHTHTIVGHEAIRDSGAGREVSRLPEPRTLNPQP